MRTMKKKVYCQPQTEMIRVEPVALLDGSIPEYDGTLGARGLESWEDWDGQLWY